MKVGSQFFKPARFPLGTVLLLPFLLAPNFSFGQTEPCGFFEIDGKPGYSSVDIDFTASQWQQSGTFPAVADYNGDGKVDLLDLTQQVNCVDNLAYGLVGEYYGINDGDANQVVTFPNFAGLSADPAVVKTIDKFEEFDNTDGFLNADMIEKFGAVFTGYLFVPEDAIYTLQISGRQGMRVYLDDIEILFFDGSPRSDSDTRALTYGLHPVRLEYYSINRNNTCSFTWSSNKPIIGSTNKTIATDYFLHPTQAVPEHAVTATNIIFEPPSGTRVTTGLPSIKAYLLTTGGDVSFKLYDTNQVLYDGLFSGPVNLRRSGVNPVTYQVNDGDGHVTTGTYYLFYDAETANTNGLAANIYVPEWYEGAFPPIASEQAVKALNAASTQLVRNGSGQLFVDGHYIGAKSLVELKGTITVPTDGTYGFRIEGQGAVFVNGRPVVARSFDYPDQYVPRGSVYLTAGRHHYQMIAGEPYGSPSMSVYWTKPSTPEELIPNSAFKFGERHRATVPNFTRATPSTGGRVGDGLIAEYIFDPADPWGDTSGNNYDLIPDNRATILPGGGLAYFGGGGTASNDAGIQIAAKAVANHNFSLEADFVIDERVSREQRLVCLQSGDRMLARVFINDNDLYYDIYDQNSNLTRVQINDQMVAGSRYHVVATFNGAVMKLYLNGVEGTPLFVAPSFTNWPNYATLSVGQTLYRNSSPGTSGRQFLGKILLVAAYNKELGPPSVATNRAANLGINPTPGTLTWPVAPVFPSPGTTQDQLDEAHHLLNRLTFGPSPQSINELISTGPNTWIQQQLNPNNIDESALNTLVNSDMFLPRYYDRDLDGLLIYRMTHAKRQLLEVMAWFWENHFNTDSGKVNHPAEELAENNRFRTHAFGHFGDLLEASAMNFPMTVYLDSDSNVVGAPNENYAREILELHTYGVDNGYTQADIMEAARCFTGWTVRDGAFYFNPGLHDYGPKSLLGLTIPAGGGLGDGIALINHLVQAQNTADFIAYKLCQVFVADVPPNDILTAVATTFHNTDGDITETLQTLFAHPRFRTDLDYRNNKIKTPLEFTISVLRATETDAISNSVGRHLEEMGMDLFNFAEPTGFSEESVDWLDTNALNLRWAFVNETTTNRRNPLSPATNIYQMAQRYQWSDYTGILDFYEDMTTHGFQSPSVRALAENWLTSGNPGTFSVNNTTLDNRVRQTLGYYLRLPEFTKQ